MPQADRPPIPATFQSYHLMIALGVFFGLVLLVSLLMHILGRLERARWLLWVLIACIPFALLAINMGWMAAEVGRQPWVVQGLHAHHRRRVARWSPPGRSGPRSACSA